MIRPLNWIACLLFGHSWYPGKPGYRACPRCRMQKRDPMKG